MIFRCCERACWAVWTGVECNQSKRYLLLCYQRSSRLSGQRRPCRVCLRSVLICKKIMRARWIGRWILCALVTGCICGCNAQRGNGISASEALQICVDQLRSEGFHLENLEIGVYPNPLTTDSIMSGRVHSTWSNREYWFGRVHEYLEGKRFWRCTCGTVGALDGDFEMYIDFNSGAILYIHPSGMHRKFPIKLK